MSGLRGLFSGLKSTVGKTAIGFSVGTGDVGGLLYRAWRVGEDVKRCGGLELGTGEDSEGNEGTGASSEHSIGSLTKLGELGGRGDTGRTKVVYAGSAKNDELCGSEGSSAQKAERSFRPGGGVWWTREPTLSGATGG